MHVRHALLAASLGLLLGSSAHGEERPTMIFLESAAPISPGPNASLKVLGVDRVLDDLLCLDHGFGCCSPFLDDYTFFQLVQATSSFPILKVMLIDPPGPPIITNALILNLMPCDDPEHPGDPLLLPEGTCVSSLAANSCDPASECECIPFAYVSLIGNTNCLEDPCSCFGSISGTVLANGVPLPNATVEVRQGLVPITVATTDNSGSFVASEVPMGLTDVSVVVPLGYQAAAPPGGAEVVSVVACEVATQNFTFNTITAPGPARPLNWWRLQDNRCMGTQTGAPQVNCSDLTGDYPSALLYHFYENDAHPIQVDGVTNGGPAVALTPAELQATLNAPGWSPWIDKAKSEFLALLLNVVSNRKLTTEVVDTNGGTVSQAIQQIAGMINDGDPSDDHAAEKLASKLNAGGSLQANTIDTGAYPDVIPFAPRPAPMMSDLRVVPNPMVRSSTLQFDLASPGNTSVRVFDVAGRLVRTLYEGDLGRGPHSMTWDGASDGGARVASGVYFYRIDTLGGTLTSRFVVMR